MAPSDDYETHSKIDLDDSLFHEEVKMQSPAASKAIKEPNDSNIAAAIDGLIANAKLLGVPVDDSRKNGFGAILFKLTDKPDNKYLHLVEALRSTGFQYWPGKGYWR
jgi:RNA polymerase primary sigma factor